PWTWEAQLQAALFDAGPGAAVGLRSAARLHEFYAYRKSSLIEVVRRRGGNHRVELGRLRETTWLPANHIVIVAGFHVTSVARTVFDLAGDPDPELRSSRVGREIHARRMAKVVNDALARRGLTFVQEAAILAALGGRGRSGTRLVRDLLARFGPRYEPTRSDAETLFVAVIEAFGLPEPERQVPLSGDRGWTGTVDFFYRAARLVIEIDSKWHDGPLDEEEDDERDAALRAVGYVVHRYRYRDLVLRPEWVVAQILAVISPA
ncbi:MAG: endonuclease domain-containing protein, partial [Acidimicrobiales bacterium]